MTFSPRTKKDELGEVFRFQDDCHARGGKRAKRGERIGKVELRGKKEEKGKLST